MKIGKACAIFENIDSSDVDYDYLDSEIAEITGCNNPSRFCCCDNFVSLWELMWNYNQEDDCCSVVEIIGNIHDNPELLKGE